MRRVGYIILRTLDIISTIAIIFGIACLVSLFFSKSFPLWRILLGVIPITAGSILKRIATILMNVFAVTDAVVDTIQERNINNNIDN